MDPRWAGETVRSEEIDDALSQLAKMVWAFHSIIAGQFSNPDYKAAFQAELYEHINPNTARAIVVATRCTIRLEQHACAYFLVVDLNYSSDLR